MLALGCLARAEVLTGADKGFFKGEVASTLGLQNQWDRRTIEEQGLILIASRSENGKTAKYDHDKTTIYNFLDSEIFPESCVYTKWFPDSQPFKSSVTFMLKGHPVWNKNIAPLLTFFNQKLSLWSLVPQNLPEIDTSIRLPLWNGETNSVSKLFSCVNGDLQTEDCF